MRGKTRREEIVGGHRRDQIQAIALIVASLVLALSLMISCGRSCGCGNGCSCGEDRIDTAGQDSTPDDVLVLTDEDIVYLRSVTEYPRLINKENPLPTGYEPPNLINLQGMPGGIRQQLNYEAANAFTDLRNAMIADGIAVDPLSGYRSYDEQANIYNYNIDLRISQGMTPEQAQEYVSNRVAKPGYSEHQYGRSIDVSIDGSTDDLFNETEQGQWIAENSHKYGFVIRYAADKTEITGYDYEPWHLRWVGNEHAQFMYTHGICLEEYIELVLKYSPDAVMRYE